MEGECPTDGAHSSESPSLELPSSPQHAISSTSPIAEVSEAPWYHELVVVIGGPDLPPVPRGLPEVPEHQDVSQFPGDSNDRTANCWVGQEKYF